MCVLSHIIHKIKKLINLLVFHKIIHSFSGFKIFIYFLIIFFSACSPEREIAKFYIKNNKNIPILFQFTDNIILTNNKIKNNHATDTLSTEKQDSIWNSNTIFLDSIDIEKQIEIFTDEFKKKLKLLGFNIFLNSDTSEFNLISTPKYKLNLTQIELVEDTDIFHDEDQFNNLIYYMDHKINILTLNLWFEFSNTNNFNKVLFKSLSIYDKIDGYFKIDNETYIVDYKYKKESFTLDQIPEFFKNCAVTNANCFYNYLMNLYIRSFFPNNYKYLKYYEFNLETGNLSQSDYNCFEEINEN